MKKVPQACKEVLFDWEHGNITTQEACKSLSSMGYTQDQVAGWINEHTACQEAVIKERLK